MLSNYTNRVSDKNQDYDSDYDTFIEYILRDIVESENLLTAPYTPDDYIKTAQINKYRNQNLSKISENNDNLKLLIGYEYDQVDERNSSYKDGSNNIPYASKVYNIYLTFKKNDQSLNDYKKITDKLRDRLCFADTVKLVGGEERRTSCTSVVPSGREYTMVFRLNEELSREYTEPSENPTNFNSITSIIRILFRFKRKK